MSGTTISNLPPAASALLSDLVPVVEVGPTDVTKSVTLQQVHDLILPTTGLTLHGDLTLIGGNVLLDNTKAVEAKNSSNVYQNLLWMDASNVVHLAGGPLHLDTAVTAASSLTAANVTSTGAATIGGTGITYSGIAGGHSFGFSWDGTFINGNVDGTGTPGRLAGVNWVNANYYTAGTSDGRYLYKSGDTCTGALQVNGNLNTQGTFMNATGVFYVANNTNYYLARNNVDGFWRFVENGTVNSTLDTSGNLTLRGSVSTPSLGVSGAASIGSNLSVGGWLYFPNLGNHAMGFGWNGNDLTSYVDGVLLGNIVFSQFINGNQYNARQIARNVNGNVYLTDAGGQVSWASSASDLRLKSNIRPTAFDALAAVNALQVYACDYKAPGDMAPVEQWDCALIAQEVADRFPQAVPKPGNDAEMLTLNPMHLAAVLWRAVQQLTERVAALEAAR